MNYQDALREWGARRIESYQGNRVTIDRSTVHVKMEFDDGYGGCPTCGTSPSADVEIWGSIDKFGQSYLVSIPVDDFDFVTVLGEIVDASGGSVTSE